MGLDQYLSAKKYLSPAEWRGESSKEQFDGVLKTVGAETFVRKEFPSAEVSVSVGYWRKANAIHQWFVDNCADGEDNCQPTYVSREKLEELRDLVHETRAERDPDLLPPQGGFFFGSTDIDEYYWKDLDETQEVLDKILSNPKFEGWDFEYQASW
jgi:hypothetical protein